MSHIATQSRLSVSRLLLSIINDVPSTASSRSNTLGLGSRSLPLALDHQRRCSFSTTHRLLSLRCFRSRLSLSRSYSRSSTTLAMFEGILVDLPFATFFLSKLKQKFNYLNDLPSLDLELYRHLIFLKHFQGDISELELYFVIVNNEYREQTEEELLSGGKTMRVTNENVTTFIHLVSKSRFL